MTPLEQLEDLESRIRRHIKVVNVHFDQLGLSEVDMIDLYKKSAAQDIGRMLLDDGAIKCQVIPDMDNEIIELRLSVATITPRKVTE